MENCIFCDIVNNRAQGSIVYRDNLCCAFMDIQPINPGHVVVIPNNHSTFLADLDDATGQHLFTVSKKIAGAIRKSGLKVEGINLLLSDGKAAFQEVYHVHLHVIPRFNGDDFCLSFRPNYFVKPTRQELDSAADKIKSSM